MIRSRWNGQRTFIMCFDGVGLKRLAALSSENLAKVTNWRRYGCVYVCVWGAGGSSNLNPWESRDMHCSWAPLQKTSLWPEVQYSEVQTTDEGSVHLFLSCMHKTNNSLSQQCLDFCHIQAILVITYISIPLDWYSSSKRNTEQMCCHTKTIRFIAGCTLAEMGTLKSLLHCYFWIIILKNILK